LIEPPTVGLPTIGPRKAAALQRWRENTTGFFLHTSSLAAPPDRRPSGIVAMQAKRIPDRPNILIVMADQLTARALPACGNRVAKTPHIDALARAGSTCATTMTSRISRRSRGFRDCRRRRALKR